ncbi:MAG: 16S rRNA (cytosine(1402)-N(4))-methyltransferase RsmH [bacterium]|nr:16S rRNA (cytosine(1402)-N(4))-methyltransferase RsmH [bacterium]
MTYLKHKKAFDSSDTGSNAMLSSPGMEPRHDSVLVKEVLKALAVQPGDTVVDATLGGAGHFKALLAELGEGGVIVGIDADRSAVERGREAYAADRRPERPVAHLVNDNFRNLARILERLGIGHVDAMLFDLGWSGFQIAAPRGFSFQNDEPLLMNYSEQSPSAGSTELTTGALEAEETAADIVNSSGETALADLIFTYGEERFARSIARAIVEARSRERILTTGALVSAIKAGTPKWYHEGRINPATRTFQALRIAVNDEIGALREGLSTALDSLSPLGRLAVISFHSIEDRMVKNMLRDAVHAGRGTLSPTKPILPTRLEILANRRARSAKLRVFERSAVHAGPAGSPAQILSYA